MKEIWQDKYKVHSYEVDLQLELTIPYLCQFMQESAWNHAENLGVGFSQLIKKNLVWILSKMKISIAKLPKWGDNITVNTWSTGYDKLFCYREFRITDEDNNTLVTGTTTWFVIDLNTRRPQRTETYFSTSIKVGEILFPDRTPKIAPLIDAKFNFETKVRFKDIDVNGHLNNVKYIEWILDTFSYDDRKNNRLIDIEINFMNEAMIDDDVIINKNILSEKQFSNNLVKKSDAKELCRVSTMWENI